jgi:hypothetical protein
VIIGTFKFQAVGSLPFGRMQRALNLHHVGSESCNEYDEQGFLIAKEHPNMEALEKAHNKLSHSGEVIVEYDLMDDGSIGNFRLSEKDKDDSARKSKRRASKILTGKGL